ncbi:MAG: ATP-dependent DNA helicase RecG [Nitrospirae bacterium]|nr:ATP-dependent DNA helicase RecG [Nitrospirota bacterium]
MIDTDTPIQYIKGVGPKRALLLERLQIKTLHDIFYYFPWRYEDRKNIKKICALSYGSLETTLGEVVSTEIITTPRKRMKILELCVKDDTGFLKCRWFNQPYLERYFTRGQKIILSGIVKGTPFAGFGFEMENPDFEHIDAGDKFIHTSRIVPVYKATDGFTPKQLRSLMFSTINSHVSIIKDFMPDDIVQKNNLLSLQEAIRETHFPEKFFDVDTLNKGISPGHRRLIFDEFFLLQFGLALTREKKTQEKGISFNTNGLLVREFIKRLPFELTNAQKRVLHEIRIDMQRPVPMNRLLHGDVGCGKTVVALISMLTAVNNDYQACLMAPTEILAEQHFINIHKMMEALGIRVVLLTSGRRVKPFDEISSGRAQIIIGTHSLIQEKVIFKNLGLAVIDEQHKFGVVQRASLRKKGFNPHIIVMTATPIPRTLALTLYGDLDISVIDELPAGRKPITTRVFFPAQKEQVYTLINREIAKGRQIYIVYPLIEESERHDLKCAKDGAEAFKKVFPNRKIGLIHGRIKQEEREKIMMDFKSGNIDILVSTTVIEVGMDVPNASLMLIVHAERFGLAQLHQLRGRIGRGNHESYCLLIAYPPFSEDARRRLKVMGTTTDGFRIAEEDLEIRGPGEFFGTRQSGMPDLSIANIIRDVDILETARREAFALAKVDPYLKNYPLLKMALQRKWMERLELVKS